MVLIRNYRPHEADSAVDAHDGTIVQWAPGGLWFWYGMSYTNCSTSGGSLSGWLNRIISPFEEFVGNLLSPRDHIGTQCGMIGTPGAFGSTCGTLTVSSGQTVKVFVSPDLSSWSEVGDAFDLPSSSRLSDAILFRPVVIYNRATARYVLWVNVVPPGFSVLDGLLKTGYRVGEATRPEGPFTLTEHEPALARHAGGDFSLLEHGGRAWIAANAFEDDHSISVQPLDSSFTDVAGAAAVVSIKDQESVGLFESNGKFYMVHGNLCCFCPEGSNVLLSVAESPMGPYTRLRELNPRSADRLPLIPAQSNGVFKARLADGSNQLVWTGDMWESARSGRKGRDVQVWLPLHVEDDAPLRFVRSWQLGALTTWNSSSAPKPPSRTALEFAALVHGGGSPFPQPHHHWGPHLEIFATFMLVLISMPFICVAMLTWWLATRRRPIGAQSKSDLV
jgi:hypothetical protein